MKSGLVKKNILIDRDRFVYVFKDQSFEPMLLKKMIKFTQYNLVISFLCNFLKNCSFGQAILFYNGFPRESEHFLMSN